ncbi:MAG TPA: hypothetical protein VFQ52_09435 [Rhizomicrobium sp.]|nr:hypothetical protein [Rhizomicrobium sp.]
MHVSRSILWLALAAAAPALAQQGINNISGDIQTQPGQTYGGLNSISGNIHVASHAEVRSAHTVSGNVTVDTGARAGDIATTSGHLKVADNARTGDLKSVSGNLALGRSVQVEGGLASVSGNIFADRGSKIDGGVVTVSGSIGLVQTEVNGDIVFVSGDVTVGVNSHVSGRITLKKPTYSKPSRPPRVVIGPNAVVDGSLEFGLPVKLYVHSTAKIGAVTGASAIPFTTLTPPKD